MQTDVRPKANLKAFLDERGVKYSWVATQLGVTPSHFHHVMVGRRELTEANAEKLAVLFGVPASTFTEAA